jgi:pimeloyl-ACP methyl ester carboxylesterase
MATPAEDAPGLLRAALEDERRVASASRRVHSSLEAAVAARCRGTDLDPKIARDLVERSVTATDGGVRFTFDPRLRSRSRWRFTELQVEAFLAAIDCPVLAVRASSGWPVPEDRVESRLRAIPDVRRVDIDGGHHVHLTHPERVAPTVLEFLTGA